MGYGERLVATNSVVKTVHVLATTTERGEVTTHRVTACGLSDVRPANARQLATAARCRTCTAYATNEHAANWQTAFGGDMLSTWAASLPAARIKAMPRRERSWVAALAERGWVPEADRAAAEAWRHECMAAWTGSKLAGAKGERVSVTARVTRVRCIEGSTVGKKGKARPMQREVTLEGTGKDAGVRWTTTTRSAAAGFLALQDEVKVTGTVYCTSYWGQGEDTRLGQIVTNAAFA